jgi:spore coat protein U-like protein
LMWSAVILLAILMTAPPARAGSCTATVGSMDFGTIDVLGNAAVYATESVSVSCSGYGASQTVLVCLGEGWSSVAGNPEGDLNNGRYLGAGGSYRLTEVTYQDAGHSAIWGAPWDVNDSSVAYQLILSTNFSGNASASFTGYGAIGAGNTAAPPGTYAASGTDVHILSHVQSGSSDICSAISPSTYLGGIQTHTGTLSATISAGCNVSTTTLNFGSTSVLSSNIDSTATITTQCTNTTPYAIGLGNGLNVSGAQRRMRLGASSTYLNYNLYTDAARSSSWLSTTSPTSCTGGASSCALGTGTGSNQSTTIYGRVPPQTIPSAGAYANTVVITVTF